MEAMHWVTVDKKAWGPGPWQDEPDKAQWQDPATGLPCLLVRQRDLGHLCGYVGVPKGHPAFGASNNDVRITQLNNADEGDDWPHVHGGLTFDGACAPHDRESWERWREREKGALEKRRAEAQRFPVGDAARLLADEKRMKALDDYDTYVELNTERYVCHVAPGEDAVWWFGFDCGHSGDISPGMESRYQRDYSAYPWPTTYKTAEYVKQQCTQLAAQLVNAKVVPRKED